MSTGIARAHKRGGAVQRGKAVVKITHNQVRKAVKPINQGKQIKKKRNKEESLSMLELRNFKSKSPRGRSNNSMYLYF